MSRRKDDRRPPTKAVDLARLMHVTAPTVIRWAKAGEIKATEVAGRWWIPADEVDRLCGVSVSEVA